jgi:hypothetical protein
VSVPMQALLDHAHSLAARLAAAEGAREDELTLDPTGQWVPLPDERFEVKVDYTITARRRVGTPSLGPVPVPTLAEALAAIGDAARDAGTAGGEAEA